MALRIVTKLMTIFTFFLVDTRVLLAVDGDKELASRARAGSSMSIHLMAADLLDELVYQWKSRPPLALPAKITLKGVSSPYGLNAQFAAFVENHLFSLLKRNPDTNIIPVYCEWCSIVTSYSTAKGTIIGRGLTNSDHEVNDQIRADFTLSIDFEVENANLILRSYLTSVQSDRIVAAKTLITDTGHPPALRDSYRLISLEEARKEYEGILASRKRIDLLFSSKISILNLANNAVAGTPFLWAMGGIETYINRRKYWLTSLEVGSSSFRGEYSAWQISCQFSRLLNYDSYDLNSPEIYLFGGFSYWEVTGSTAQIFAASRQLTPGQIIETVQGGNSKPKESIPGLTIGAELRIGEFVRMKAFIESFPTETENTNFQKDIHSYGFGFGMII